MLFSTIIAVNSPSVGKTTLAIQIYNHFYSHDHFEHYCFLRDVQSSQTFVLQKKVLRDFGLGSKTC